MSRYWKEHSSKATVEEMMLDNNAALIVEEETQEVLHMLPAIKDQRIVELGAGIGRFTEFLAGFSAKHVLAVDFMESFIAKNKANNGHFNNIDFLVTDVTTMNYKENSTDLVFSNWLFMYLHDHEVQACFQKILSWLVEGGYFFMRESCFHRSGTKQRTDNPTQYRQPLDYNRLIKSVFQSKDNQIDGRMEGYGFDFVFARPSRTYIKYKENSNQICWLLRKVPQKRSGRHWQREQELDSYFTERNIGKLQSLFGQDFLSSGGLESTQILCRKLGIQRGQTVLDVGCGLGGSAFHISDTYGAEVVALDRSETMIGMALARAHDKGVKKVAFDIANIETTNMYPENYFDIIYSRDVLLYVEEKQNVLHKFMKWLKPGGKLFITDYCCNKVQSNLEAFESFLQENSYKLVSLSKYQSLLSNAEFHTVKMEDISDWFCQLLERELEGLQLRKDNFISEFGVDQYQQHLIAWKNKLETCRRRELIWVMFQAEKTVNEDVKS